MRPPRTEGTNTSEVVEVGFNDWPELGAFIAPIRSGRPANLGSSKSSLGTAVSVKVVDRHKK